MFAYSLQRRFADDKISVFCIDPGKVRTEGEREREMTKKMDHILQIRSNFIDDACGKNRVLKTISSIILKGEPRPFWSCDSHVTVM